MIFAQSLPGAKRFLRPARLTAHAAGFLLRLLAAFVADPARKSAAQAAAAVKAQSRHRAQVSRFLAQANWSKDWAVLDAVAGLLLAQERRRGGTWLLVLDQTQVGQQGQKTENTFSRANYRRRARKSNRKQKQYARRSCHCWVVGLLLTPSGLRVPSCRSYYTHAYCAAKGRPYRKQTELAAELIAAAAVPAGARVVVLGDTAFEAKVLREACQRRGFRWVVPINPERVLAGPKPRPKVASLVTTLPARQFQAVRLVPGRGAYAAQRRAARCRVGPKAKARVFYAHAERRAVHNVGDVLLVFSTKEKPKAGQAVRAQKVLMSDDLSLRAAEVVELYDLRWQVELFFKECKSTLGWHRYRFRDFAKAENWVQACLVSFTYLEWHRARQLRQRRLAAAQRRWWAAQRSHGVCAAVRQEVEGRELKRLAEGARTPTGLRKLRRLLRAALPAEYREPQGKPRKHAA